MFSIGELSKLTQLSVKTLRFYHEEGLLVPAFIDPDTGYRYYDESHVETARVIVYLRSLEFPLSEIKELLRSEGEERQAQAMAQHVDNVQEKLLEPVLVGGIRAKGRYSDCGRLFGRLGRACQQQASPQIIEVAAEFFARTHLDLERLQSPRFQLERAV